MKNKKSVGRRITSGFVIVIILALVLSGVTIASSVLSNRNLGKINSYSALQTNGNEVLDDYNVANTEAQKIYVSMNQDAYNTAMAAIDSAFANLEEGLTDDAALEGKYQEGILGMTESFKEWKDTLTKIQSDREQLEASEADVESLMASFGQAAQAFYDNQLSELSSDPSKLNASAQANAAAGNNAGGRAVANKMDNQLKTIVEVIFNVGDLGRLSSSLTNADDMSSLDGIQSEYGDSKALIENLKSQNLSEEYAGLANTLGETFESYVNALKGYGDTLEELNADISQSESQSAALKTMTSGAVNSIDGDMEALINTSLTTANMSLIISIVVSILIVVLAVVISRRVTKSITAPVNMLNGFISIVRNTGRLRPTEEELQGLTKMAASGDEIGQSLTEFYELAQRLVALSDDLEAVSQGDLTVDVKPVSGEDTMSIALKRMADNLNSMFSDIHDSTSMVSNAGAQLAAGAQTLAQGATEQASSIQELSASLSEVSERTKENAGLAKDAARLGENMRTTAEKGSGQMQDMISAVNDINEASNNINKVIKVIDDIAFQTNILALNAAVEAARAGAHGKGFAVVAEEVRNLAAKSSEAAKETGSLISDTIAKAEAGAGIAALTEKSLTEIVEGIEETSRSLEAIAGSSNMQSDSLSQISTAVDQVAEVVQHNSATAEESAASSEELNSQAQVLQSMVERFKLRDK